MKARLEAETEAYRIADQIGRPDDDDDVVVLVVGKKAIP